MAIAFRAIGAAGAGGNVTASAACGAPAGLAEGDIVFVFTLSGASQAYESVTDNNANELSQIAQTANTNLTGGLWWYRVPATVPTSFTCDRGGGGGQFLCVAYAFSGCVGEGTPFEDATVSSELGSAETTPDTAEIDTTGPDEMAVCVVGIDDDPDWDSGFPPAGPPAWSDGGGVADTAGSDARIEMIYRAVPTAGNVPSVVIGTLPGAEFWYAVTLALIPAVTGGEATEVNPGPAVAATAVPSPAVGLVLAPAPSAAVIQAVVPAPTAGLSLELAPAPAEATLVVPAPTVTFGTLATTAGPAEATLVVPAPAVTLTLEAAPAPVEAELVIPAPTVTRTLAATAAPTEAKLVVPAPTITLSLAATATPAEAELVVPAPTVTVAGAGITAAPAPVVATVTAPQPTITVGQPVAPDPVVTTIVVPHPQVALRLPVQPAPVVVSLTVPPPAGQFAYLTAAGPVVSVLVVPAPKVVREGIGVVPATRRTLATVGTSGTTAGTQPGRTRGWR